ncbi:SHQ1 protein-domain-containing protein [Dichotomocladium elegans]|nr:SHQ1 protein-domain-containing protein [Dichotomocladium elegans]
MITPTFKVDQDEHSVIICINTPYVRAQDVDLHVQGSEFRFFLRPYFLRLNFPGNLVEDDASSATYDPSAGQFTVKVSKETKGEHFPDLDLLTKLLARRGEPAAATTGSSSADQPKKPLIEVVGETNNADFQEAIDYNWELPQELPAEELLMSNASYGFNNHYSGYFKHVRETANEINDLSDPEKSSAESRRRERIEAEDEKFDEDHYAMDYITQKELEHLLKFKTLWSKELRRIQKNAKEASNPLIQEVSTSADNLDLSSLSIIDHKESLIKFSEKEQTMMRQLPNKEFLLSNQKSTYLGLVDLMFAYSYNHRIFEGENSVESIWCIGKLSATLSYLEQFTTLKDVMIACFRRALAYPLYRNFALCEKVLQDVYVLFKLGKRAILKALLEMKDVFDHHDVYYVYSKIYIDDYCIWIQHASDHVIRTLAHELHHFTVSKDDIGWDLEELETIAREMEQQQQQDE